MKKAIKISFLFVVVLSFSCIKMQGQSLPSLERSKEISQGALPNGIEYYIVNNSHDKGFADYALIRKEGILDDNGRKSLTYLKHFVTRQPYRLLSENGVAYGPEGFVSRLPDATLFSFKDIPTYKSAMADSTLMMIMDIASGSRSPQAIVISGDIDVAKVKERMNLLSMMAGKLDKPAAESSYQWTPTDVMEIKTAGNNSRNLATIEIIYTAARQDKSVMNTAIPIISRSYAEILQHILKDRISKAFAREGVSLAGMDFRYIDSSQNPYGEYYDFKVRTSATDMEKACGIISSQLASIDKFGAGEEELKDAKSTMEIAATQKPDYNHISNSEYVDKCVAAYLYGANLAPQATIDNFLYSKNLAVKDELRLVNGFASALLHPRQNISLRFDSPLEIDTLALKNTFIRSWDKASAGTDSRKAAQAEQEPKGKIKLKSTATETISGGQLWTFSNGIKVVYKHVPSNGRFQYALMLKHSLASFPDLKYGEAAFVNDMLDISIIADTGGADFKRSLISEGITMDEQVSISDMRICGSAPKSRFGRLMNALLSVGYERKADQTAFEAYKKAAVLREDFKSLQERDVLSLMDSLIRPEYIYMERGLVSALGDDLATRANDYFDEAFSKVNDGLLVLIGDLDAEETKKELCRYLGAFQTSNKLSNRTGAQGRFSSGTLTITKESASGSAGGKERGTYFLLSAPLTYNINNYMAFKAAGMVIEKELAKHLVDYGAYAELKSKLELYPAERMYLYISCHPCDAKGLPLGIVPASPSELLSALRSFVADLPEIKVSDEDMKAYKAWLSNDQKLHEKEVANMMEAVLIRYSDGKDIVSGKSAAINSLNPEKVSTILKALNEGPSIEYVIE